MLCTAKGENHEQYVDLKLEVIAIPVSDVDRAKPSTADWGGRSTPISWSGRTFERSN
jgi:hypothetical protein